MIEKLRKTINEIDAEMAKLFEKRMDAVKGVAEYKKLHGLAVLDEKRENEVIERNSHLIENEEYKPYYVSFLKSNMLISKKMQHRLLNGTRVAFSGVNGAFAHIASGKIFPDAELVGYGDFKSAYNSVENGECDLVVLPIENSFNGDVGQVMDLCFFGSLHISGIYDIPVVHNLLAKKGAKLSDIKTVVSHSQALGQCASFLQKHGFEVKEVVNTAVAAKLVSESERNDIAAIASGEAAEIFSLKTLRSHINDSGSNTTRFAVLSPAMKQSGKDDKHFVIMFTVSNSAGALSKAVSAIGENGFNLRALKSRPTKELIWDYYFYAEGEGNIFSADGEKMLGALKECCSSIKVVGSFEKELSL